jgi:hypothetical protein
MPFEHHNTADVNGSALYNDAMPGFLDPYAVSIQAEYTRYLDPDVLGKIVLKNFAINVLGLKESAIRIPVSRQGDEGNYKELCDAGIRIGSRSYSVETKLSRQIISARSRLTADPSPRWMFSKLKYSARSKIERCDYELLFAVGINSPGLEDSREYWRHLHALRKKELAEGRPFDFSVWPHDAAFLTRCGFYIIPRTAITVDHMDVTIRKIPRGKFDGFFGWGNDFGRLRDIWHRALANVNVSLVEDNH